MNKAMEWVLQSLERYLKEKDQSPLLILKQDQSEDTDGITICACGEEQSWYIIKHLLFMDIKHISLYHKDNGDDEESSSYINFDLKNDGERSFNFF